MTVFKEFTSPDARFSGLFQQSIFDFLLQLTLPALTGYVFLLRNGLAPAG